MIKKYFIATITIAFVFIGSGENIFASASMPMDQPNTEKVEQQPTTNDRFTFQDCWQQWFAFDKDVEQSPIVPEEEVEDEVENNTENNVENKEENKEENVTSDQLNAFEQEVFTLTNKEREKHGLAPFKIDTELSKVAREKSLDMANKRYFDHQSPTYGSPFDMMKQFGITYRTAGENIAMGQRTPSEVVTAWMNSEGHRANILNGNFTHIGIGYVENGHYWTQQFIGK